MTDPTHRLLTWDWREQPDLKELGRALAEVSGGRIHLAEVETGDDQFAIVIADAPVSEAEATEIYRTRWEDEDV